MRLLQLSKALGYYYPNWQLLSICSLIHLYEASSVLAASFSVGPKSHLKGAEFLTLPLSLQAVMEPRCRPAQKGLSFQHWAASPATSFSAHCFTQHVLQDLGGPLGSWSCSSTAQHVPPGHKLQSPEPAPAAPPEHIPRAHSSAAVDRELGTKQSVLQHVCTETLQ